MNRVKKIYQNVRFVLRVGRRLLRRLPQIAEYLDRHLDKQIVIDQLNKRLGCCIHPDAVVKIDYAEDIYIAPGGTIGQMTIIHVVNEHEKIRNSKLIIGEGSHILEQNNIRAAGGNVIIGKNCMISQQVSIIASNHLFVKGINIIEQPWDDQKTGVTIGDDVWIGCGCQIMPGSHIGNGAVVAAGSVVVGFIQENTVVAGVPARKIRDR